MSYSYIKSVFPKFEYSTVYDDKLYKNLNMELKPADFKPSELYTSVSAPEIIQYNKVEQKPVQVPMQEQMSHLLSNVNPFDMEESRQAQIINKKTEMFQNNLSIHPQNNLRVYQQPIINNNIPNYNNIDVSSKLMNKEASMPNRMIEGFDETNHDLYIKHVMDCPICKERLLKQFNIETERIKNEQIMEMISYVMFGVFVLILLDNLKK